MDTSTETSPVDDLAAARATTLFTSLNTHVMTTGLSAERLARWLWAHPPDEGRDLLPVLWADLADWSRDVAEHLADLADATLGPTMPLIEQGEDDAD